jgi:hypothetical protein
VLIAELCPLDEPGYRRPGFLGDTAKPRKTMTA